MNVRGFEALNPDAKVIAFKGGTHELHLQYPHEVAESILRFLGGEPEKCVVADGFAGSEAGQGTGPELGIH
jgi:hypothetical protein